jgi:hypothetical protein
MPSHPGSKTLLLLSPWAIMPRHETNESVKQLVVVRKRGLPTDLKTAGVNKRLHPV